MEQIKVGDKVRVREDAPKVYLRGWGKVVEYNVYAVDGDAAIITYGHQEIAIPLKYLIKVEDEAKEPKFKVGDRVRVCDKAATRYGHVGTVVHACATGHIEVDFDNGYAEYYHYTERDLEPYTEPTEEKKLDGITEETANELSDMLEDYCNVMDAIKDKSYWDAYAADLAKEIAVKIVNKYDDPKEVADYAVSVAKAVAAGLKKK